MTSSTRQARLMHAAATVLLLREFEAELEVLMMRRGAGLSFMAGMWVFPGGRVDAADARGVRARVSQTRRTRASDDLQTLEGEPVPAEAAVALRVAACRETFEEAGVLLARDAQAAPCPAERVEALQAERAAPWPSNAASFVAMLEGEDLYLDVDRLVYWSHWITPSLEPKRFDTRFFAIAVPPGQAGARTCRTHAARVGPTRPAPEAIERARDPRRAADAADARGPRREPRAARQPRRHARRRTGSRGAARDAAHRAARRRVPGRDAVGSGVRGGAGRRLRAGRRLPGAPVEASLLHRGLWPRAR